MLLKHFQYFWGAFLAEICIKKIIFLLFFVFKVKKEEIFCSLERGEERRSVWRGKGGREGGRKNIIIRSWIGDSSLSLVKTGFFPFPFTSWTRVFVIRWSDVATFIKCDVASSSLVGISFSLSRSLFYLARAYLFSLSFSSSLPRPLFATGISYVFSLFLLLVYFYIFLSLS